VWFLKNGCGRKRTEAWGTGHALDVEVRNSVTTSNSRRGTVTAVSFPFVQRVENTVSRRSLSSLSSEKASSAFSSSVFCRCPFLVVLASFFLSDSAVVRLRLYLWVPF
jgi:hypothetical protein